MVPERRLALRPTDKLLAGYLSFVSLVVVARGMLPGRDGFAILSMHALFGVMLYLFTRLTPAERFGNFMHDMYPVLMLIPFYGEFGLINDVLGPERVLAHDTVVQRWEAALFGGQVSYEWIRRAPSVFWSGVLHAAYFAYYPIVLLGPLLPWLRGKDHVTRAVVFSMMLAFVPCYVTFLVYPVAGPYYAFPHPVGPVREVGSAELVYGLLADASSLGAAFPSSHVAATVAVTWAIWQGWRRLAAWFIPAAVLLTVGTVYCQMHYGIDALLGTIEGLLMAWIAQRWIIQPNRSGAFAPA